VTGGTLGPRAVQELRAITQRRAMLQEQMAILDRQEASILSLVAEAQGDVAAPNTRYDYDLDAATWRPIDGPTPPPSTGDA
jgi:hypothetical protein